jgi:tRNA threonylcarbamoyladenosine biosynthesis protein TsaB
MMIHIETSTEVCSVALSDGGQVVFSRVAEQDLSHAALAAVFVDEALAAMRERGGALRAVAVSSGPGSYTGLRVGVSLAKGLCFGFGVPLVAVPTLDLLAATAVRCCTPATDGCVCTPAAAGGATPAAEMLYCAMLDARRMEVYAAVYDGELAVRRTVAADIVTEDTYAAYLQANKVCFFGNGAAKCKAIISSPQAVFLDGVRPLAENMAPLAEKAFAEGRTVDVAYFEPFYLKEFQATQSKNPLIGSDAPLGK